MKVYGNIEEFRRLDKAVVTTGTFDGVHVGHQQIIKRLRAIAEKEGGETVLLTFSPHPRMVLFPDSNEIKLLTTEHEKIELLEKYGIDHLIIHPFTKNFSRLSSLEFVRNILVNKIGTSKLVIGYNHHFGRNREGTFEHLKEYGPVYGFEIEEIPAQDVDNINVSSTKIRNAIKNGDIFTANLFLGHQYSLRGIVVEGDKIGREIGFPTANVMVKETYKLIPGDGVYAVDVYVNNVEYKGMLNIGIRPTLDKHENVIEVNIFEFDQNIYGEEIVINFRKRIRNEVKFNDLSSLKNQLIKDKLIAIQ